MIGQLLCSTLMTVLSMKTNKVTPTASNKLIGKMNAQKLTSMLCPAQTNGGARVIVNPYFGIAGDGVEGRNSITSTGPTGSTRLANAKAM